MINTVENNAVKYRSRTNTLEILLIQAKKKYSTVEIL